MESSKVKLTKKPGNDVEFHVFKDIPGGLVFTGGVSPSRCIKSIITMFSILGVERKLASCNLHSGKQHSSKCVSK